jgi:hypothetical protein
VAEGFEPPDGTVEEYRDGPVMVRFSMLGGTFGYPATQLKAA